MTEKKAKIIVMYSSKGGIGKTTLSINLAAYLAKKGEKVLVVDNDGQANTTKFFLGDEGRKLNGLAEVLRNEKKEEKNSSIEIFDDADKQKDIHEYIYQTAFDNIHIIPSKLRLNTTEKYILAESGDIRLMRNLFLQVENEFNYIIIDCAPSLGILVSNALCAADLILIPCPPDEEAIDGVDIVISSCRELAQKRLLKRNCDFKVILNMVHRNNEDRKYIDNIREKYKSHVYENTIRFQSKPCTWSYGQRKPLLELNDSISDDVGNLLDEVCQSL